jgi:hypothetical protein
MGKHSAINEKFFSLVAGAVRRHMLQLLFVSLGTPLGAQVSDSASRPVGVNSDGRMQLARIDAAIELDGFSREQAWQQIDPLPLTMHIPTFRAPLTERSEIRIAHDDDYIYVSGRLFDTEPSGIRINSMYRDRWNSDDNFGIMIDAFDDNDNGLWFWTTPAGVRGDATISGDGYGPTNGSWNTHWDVATAVTEDGWFAEMRIPFSSLGFQATAGRVEIAVITYRYIARKNEWQVFPAIPPEFTMLRPSMAQDAVLEGVQTHRPVYITPYLLSGVDRTNQLNDAGDSFDFSSEVDYAVGGDLKYNVTNNATLDLTVNTDFAQVEADDYQVNLTRFPLFYPEKRQFFQERSSTFYFLTGGATRLFHSRRIGLDQGEPVPIIGGARFVGRMGDWDLGVLNMQTARTDRLPSENFGVARFRRRVINQYSNAGAMVTSRLGTEGGYNVAYGLDGSIRYSGDDYFTAQWAQTIDDGIIADSGFRFMKAALVRVTASRARQRGFTYAFSLRYSGADYNPEMGFVTRQNFTDLFYSLAYFHYPEGGPFRRIDPFQLFGSVAMRNADRTIESAFVEHDFDLQWNSGASLGRDLELYYEDLRESLFLPNETEVAPGSYTFPRFEGDYNMAPGSVFRSSFGWGIQKFYDGWLWDIGLYPRWSPSRFLGLSAVYQLNVARFPSRDQGFDSHLVRLRIEAALNTKLSLNAFIQLSNTAYYAAANVRIRYNFKEGSDLWVVYNEGMNLDRHRASPSLPLSDARTLMLKYTYTFVR